MRRRSLLALIALASCIRPGETGSVVWPSAPSVTVYWMGSAEQPWIDLESAVRAALDVTSPAAFELQVWGANDRMDAPSTLTVVCPLGAPPSSCASTLGSFEANECAMAGLGCRPVVRVRQLRAVAAPRDPLVSRVMVWSGPLLAIDAGDSTGHVAAIWDELVCRRIGLDDTGAACDVMRAKARARYAALRHAAAP